MGRSQEYTIQIKASSAEREEGAFEGDLSVYGNIDDVGDIVEPGFFDKTLASRTHFPLLWQHDMTQPIGSFDVVSADGPSLRIDGKFNMGVAKGREAYELLKAGDIDGLSIGYTVDDYRYDNTGIRHLLDGELYEGSLVTFPANRLARAQAKQRLSIMERKSKYAGLKFLEKMTDEEREAALAELDAMVEEDKPAEDEEKADDAEADISELIEALKDCGSRIDKLIEQNSPKEEE